MWTENSTAQARPDNRLQQLNRGEAHRRLFEGRLRSEVGDRGLEYTLDLIDLNRMFGSIERHKTSNDEAVPRRTTIFNHEGSKSSHAPCSLLRPCAPFRLDLTVWALRRRALNEVDAWDGATYRRALVLDDMPVEVAVTQGGGTEAPELYFTLTSDGEQRNTRLEARSVLEKVLSLELALDPFYLLAAADPVLAPLASRFRGLRPPRFPSVFECLVNAVALQQLSLAAGLTLLNRLSRSYGACVSAAGNHACAFPGPAELTAAKPDDIRTLGFSLRKATTIVAVAHAANEGLLDLEALSTLDDERVVEILTEIPGIGRWSAEYTLLRGLGRLHVFPGDDVGARKNLARWLGLGRPLDYDGVQRAVAGWRPYAGLVYFHLLLDRLAARGYLE
jgi:DNA-3-methyladenine glycosylase II